MWLLVYEKRNLKVSLYNTKIDATFEMNLSQSIIAGPVGFEPTIPSFGG
jgi:hypothetical protein